MNPTPPVSDKSSSQQTGESEQNVEDMGDNNDDHFIGTVENEKEKGKKGRARNYVMMMIMILNFINVIVQ